MPMIDPTADIHARLAMAEAALKSIGQRLAPELRQLDIAVLIPACNHAATIAEAVRGFRIALPHARVYVYDNNSRDNTSAIASEAGAIVRREPQPGRHNVIRRMFSDIEADVYLLADAEGGHDAASAPRLISRLIETHADMAVGARVTRDKRIYDLDRRPGDRLISRMITRLFGERLTDLLSSYRAFSRRFVKSFPARRTRIDSELAFAAHALDLGMIMTEVQTIYHPQAEDSVPARRPVRDRLSALAECGRMLRDHRPLTVFSVAAAGCAAAAFAPGAGAAMAAASVACLCSGLAIAAVNVSRREVKRLTYNGQESLVARLERHAETRMSLDSLRAQALVENPARDMPEAREVPAPRRMRVN